MDGATTRWKCQKGHVLGQVERVKVGGHTVARLMLYREAIDLSANGTMAEVDVIAVVEGTTLDVRCSVPGCSCVRSWYIGEDAIKRMVGTYLAE